MTDARWWKREQLERDRLDAKIVAGMGLKLLATVPAVIVLVLLVIRTFNAPGLIALSLAGLACVYTLVAVTAGLIIITVGILGYRRLSQRLQTFDAPAPLPVARLVVHAKLGR